MNEPDTTTMFVRPIDAGAAQRIRQAARARNLTIGQYLARLVDLHDAMRGVVDTDQGEFRVHRELDSLGLLTVHS